MAVETIGELALAQLHSGSRGMQIVMANAFSPAWSEGVKQATSPADMESEDVPECKEGRD
jgi:hypothetical protein